jgi:hypothetical protein
MGIDISAARWLKMIKDKYHVDYSDTLTLGRQLLLVKPYTKRYKKRFSMENIISEDGYAERFLQYISGGGANISSLDYSKYEDATYVWDMNDPVPEEYKSRFSCVIDGGTMEHVFDYSIAIKNAMDMVKVGGHLILLTPANNYCGHGFYQFSPELFYSLLKENNGYKIEQITSVENGAFGRGIFRELRDNTVEAYRLCLYTKKETLLFVLAKRIGDVPENINPQQSDYVALWGGLTDDEQKNTEKKKTGMLHKLANKSDVLYWIGSRIMDYINRKNLRKKCIRYNPDKDLT